MSKHRTTPQSRAAHPHGRGASTSGPQDLDTLDQPTDVLSFGSNEHTEIQKDLGAIAAFRNKQAPAPSLYDDSDRTEVNADIDVDAVREMARRRFASSGQHARPARKLSPQPTPVSAPQDTFDADEKTEFGLDLNSLAPGKNTPRTRFATTAAQAVEPRQTGRTSGAHPRAQRAQSAAHPAQSKAPSSVQPQRTAPSPHVSGQYPRAQQPSPRVSGAHPGVHAPRTSGMHPQVQGPHTSGAYPAARSTTPHADHERTEPSREALAPSEPTATLEPLVVDGPSTLLDEQTVDRPQLGYIDLGLQSPLVAPRVRKQVEFLKEETGVDFDPMAMSSPNLNALVLALGAQQANLQETAMALVKDESDEVIALHLKWGEPGSPPSRRMRVHYGLWGGFAGLCAGLAVIVTLALVTGSALSSFGAASVLLPLLGALALGGGSAFKPRQVEALLFKSKLLPAPTSSPLSSPSSPPTAS